MSSDGHNPTTESELAVMEANEYKQKRRLRRILDSHDNVEERADEAYQLYVRDEISKDARNVLILKAVQAYLREVHNLMLEEHNPRQGSPNYYWYPFVTDGDDVYIPDDAPVDEPLGQIEMAHSENQVFFGLRDVLYADEMYSETWKESYRTRHSGVKTDRHKASYSVPEDVSWKAYLWINRFLDDSNDLEIKFEEIGDELPTWGFTEVDDPDVEDTADLAREEMNGD